MAASNVNSKSINNDLTDDQKTSHEKEYCGGRWKVLFFLITFIVHAALLIKCPLFILRRILPPSTLPELCPDHNVSQLGQDEIFTLTVYSSLFIGRFVESLILQIHIYKFFFRHCKQIEITEYKNKLVKMKWFYLIILPLSIYMFIHSLSIPVLGILLELRSGRETDCESYTYEYHTMYWMLDIIRYFYDVAIRLLMVAATMVIGMIWSEKKDEEVECIHNEEPNSYEEYFKDRDMVSRDHYKRSYDYFQRGKKVEDILEIFQTWFVIPWVLFFVASSLKTEHILRSWNEGTGSQDGHYDLSDISYMIYSFNQLGLLLLPYLCSMKMNTHHCNYVSKSREAQLSIQKTASRMAFAHLNKIEEQQHFTFVPRIWGTSIKIPVDDPLFIVLIFVGLFFTVMEGLI